ncbi:hypothetical protein SARC_15336, partial [Sphaeroforma arctica JP610]
MIIANMLAARNGVGSAANSPVTVRKRAGSRSVKDSGKRTTIFDNIPSRSRSTRTPKREPFDQSFEVSMLDSGLGSAKHYPSGKKKRDRSNTVASSSVEKKGSIKSGSIKKHGSVSSRDVLHANDG